MRRINPFRSLYSFWVLFFALLCSVVNATGSRLSSRDALPSKLNFLVDFDASGAISDVIKAVVPYLQDKFSEVTLNFDYNHTRGYGAIRDLQSLPKTGEHIAVLAYPDLFLLYLDHQDIDQSSVQPLYGISSHPMVLVSPQFSSIEELFEHADSLPSGEKYPICSPSLYGAPYLTHLILARSDGRGKRLDYVDCGSTLFEDINNGIIPACYLGVPSSLNLTENVKILGASSSLPLPYLPEAPLFTYSNVPDEKTSVSVMLYVSKDVPEETKIALAEAFDKVIENHTVMRDIRALGTSPLMIKYPDTLIYEDIERDYVDSVINENNTLSIVLGTCAGVIALVPIVVLLVVFSRQYYHNKNDPTGEIVDEKLQDFLRSDTTQSKIIRILTSLRNEAPADQQVLFNRALILLSSDMHLVEAPDEREAKLAGDDKQFSIKESDTEDPSNDAISPSNQGLGPVEFVTPTSFSRERRFSSFDTERKFIESFAGKMKLADSGASSDGNASGGTNCSADGSSDVMRLSHSDSVGGERAESSSACSYSEGVPRPLPVDSEEQSLTFIIKLGPELDKWEYSPAWLQRVSHGHPLRFAFVYFVHRFRLGNRWPLQLMGQWADAIEAMYFDYNAFHTSLHAADTLQAAAHLATLPSFDNMFTREQLFCLLVACAIHDVGHVARTNAFLAQTSHPYAITYSDTAVLESMSLAKSFQFMNKHPRLNLLSRMPKARARAFRSLLIELVLATDLAQHFSIIDRAKQRLAVSAFDSSCAPLLLDIIIKCADISNAARPFNIAERWSQSLLEEFYSQGEEEQLFGLPMSNFMDRSNPQVSKSQSVFYKAIVAPLFACFSQISGDHSFEDTVLENLQKWESMPNAKPQASLRWFHKHGVGEPKAPEFIAPAPKKRTKQP